MRTINLKILASIVILVLITSCKREHIVKADNKKEIDPNKVYKLPTTVEEKLLVENLTKITAVFKELYKNNSNVKLVNAALFSKAYTDQSVLLRDLIYPENSRLNNVLKFKKYTQGFNVSLNQFSTNFWKEVDRKNDPAFTQFLSTLKKELSAESYRTDIYDESGNEVSVYYPYMENFEVPYTPDEGGYYAPITSLVTATADADEGWGSLPYYIDGVFQYYQDVLINDEYAELNPTHIVGVNGIEAYTEPPIENSAFPPSDPIDLPNLPREIKQVYVGDVKCKKQYDALISFTGNGGGSEIVFTRSDGFLKVMDGQAEFANTYFTQPKTIERKSIRKEWFVNFAISWDEDWELANLQQNIAIFEEDNRNSSTFNGSLKTIVTIPGSPATGGVGVTAERSLGFTINFKSDDALIRQINYNRDVFFILNRTNLEGEMKNGWPVRDRYANVSYTLNDRTYY